MNTIRKVTVIGAGNMGGAIACGMAKGSVIRPEDITVTARTPASLDRIRAVYPEITVFTDNRTAVGGADLIIIAVKPWQIESVVEEIRDCVELGRTVIASVVAGVAFRQLSSMFYPVSAEEDAGGSGRQNAQERLPMFRIIPNTAVSVGCSTTFIASDAGPDFAGDVIGRQIDAIFREMGDVLWVEENMLDAGMALASCGIAYALKYMEASIQGGVGLGFTEEEARRAVIGTVEGAVSLLKSEGSMPAREIDKVTTPGGYTFKGLKAMEDNGFSESVIAGLNASCK